MKRTLATLGAGLVLATPLTLGLGGAAAAAPSSTGAEIVTVQETVATTSVTAHPGGHVEPSLAVVLAVGLVAGATGSAYLVRRSRCTTAAR